ncbi:MAG: tetratricopeptide repeat protein [Desulfobacula sp.]|uniref:tetratricopeptide repeat protein n=1 Tax=Desulfobacula sp. TaxID=2593537 RepID=UPI0025BD72E4|nr:tetratricopeptide repeat protein [Desulfobacula sp.]MCD4722507.1 tetratricopeptide repeat protein [Desulfobacula sp.]
MKTNNKRDNIFEENLVSMIKALPEDASSENLTLEVMSRLRETDKSFFEKLADLFRHRVTISFSPVKAVCVTVLLLVGLLFIQVDFPPGEAIDTAKRIENIYPATHSSNYFLGRSLLTQGAYERSIGFFKQAVVLNPVDSDYHFWLGVNYGNLKDYQNERISYLKAISLTPGHLMSHYFLGHSYLNDKKWDMALEAYDNALSIRPALEQALFNRGLALKGIGHNQEEIQAWKRYLAVKKTGLWALRAAAHLNASGDFSYRTYQIGKQKMVMGPFLTNDVGNNPMFSVSSLDRLGESLRLSPDLDLFVIVYLNNNPDTAEYQAKNIKNKLLENFPEIDSARIKISWFGIGEEMTIGNKSFFLKQSVRFLGFKRELKDKGVNI